MSCALMSVMKITKVEAKGVESCYAGKSAVCLLSKLGKFPEGCRVGDLDLLAPQLHPSLFGKALEQTADDFARAAKFVGQRLMGSMYRVGLVDNQFGEALVELLKCHGGNQLHQVSEPVGKQQEHVIAKRFMLAEQSVE